MKLRYKISGALLALLAAALVALAIVLSYNSACPANPPAIGHAENMKAIIYRCYGATDVLALEDIAVPDIADHELLVKVRAAAINPLDWHYMRGSPYFMRLMSGLGAPKDIGMGVDFAGTVERVGRQVTRFKRGDKIFGGTSGALAEYVSVREQGAVARVPANITFEQAASVPVAAITALQALRDKAQLKEGQQVLINGASGGVGTFAVQIAKSMGATVTGVCSTRNVDMVRSIGADHVVDYTREDYTQSNKSYDVIIDNVGNRALLDNTRVLKPGGVLVMVGGPGGDWIGPLIVPIKAMLVSPFVDQRFENILAQLSQQDLEYLGGLMRKGELIPVIDRRYALRDSAAAIAYSETGRARGKIIVTVD